MIVSLLNENSKIKQEGLDDNINQALCSQKQKRSAKITPKKKLMSGRFKIEKLGLMSNPIIPSQKKMQQDDELQFLEFTNFEDDVPHSKNSYIGKRAYSHSLSVDSGSNNRIEGNESANIVELDFRDRGGQFTTRD